MAKRTKTKSGPQGRGVFERPTGSGIWWARYHDEQGREHRERVGPKGLAGEVYRKRKTEIAERRFFPERIRRREVRLAELVDDYLKRIERTHRSYSESVRHGALWKAALPGRTLREIVTGDLERYIAGRLAGELRPTDRRKGKRRRGTVLAATVNRELSFLRRVFNVAIADGLAEANPVKPKLFAKENNARVRFLTADEEAELQPVLDEAAWSKVALALHTGLRRGEQFGLRWEHVDFAVGIITIPRSKSGEARRVAMNDAARELLRALPSRLKSAWVFSAQNSQKPLDAKNFVSRVFLPALKAAGIKNFRWHDLRHTFASRLVMAGVDLRTVQELMGHQSYEMTLRYSHLAPAHTMAAVQRLCGPTAAVDSDATGTTTGTSASKTSSEEKSLDVKTTEAPDPAGASERAGDRGRTGDVQLGKLAFYH
jgi:integrase